MNENDLALKQMFGGKTPIIMGGAVPEVATIYNTSLAELRAEVNKLCNALPYKEIGETTFKEHAVTGEVLYFQELKFIKKSDK